MLASPVASSSPHSRPFALPPTADSHRPSSAATTDDAALSSSSSSSLSSPSAAAAAAAAAVGPSSSTSLFSVKLQREMSKLPDAQWRAAFIDYQRLRKQIKKIVYYEQEAKQQHEAAARTADTALHSHAASPSQSAPAAEAPSPSSSAAVVGVPSSLSLSSAHRDRLRKSRDVFWCVLKAEIEKVNGFFSLKEEEANRHFAAVGLDSDSEHTSSGGSASGLQAAELATDRLVFAKLLLEQHPRALAERLLPPPLFDSASAVSWSVLPAARVALLTAFLSLCALLDQLRKFVVINYVVVLKILKKYDEYTIRSTKDELSRELSDEPFATSARLASLLQRAERITFRLLPPIEGQQTGNGQLSQSAAAPATSTTAAAAAAGSQESALPFSASESSLCPICHKPLANPVQLQCSHRCCFNCLASHTVARSFSCPVCAKQQEFDSLDLGLESVLTKFAGVSLTDRERLEGERHLVNTQPLPHALQHQQQQQQSTVEPLIQQSAQLHLANQSSMQSDGSPSSLPRVKTESAGGTAPIDVAAAASSMAMDFQQQQQLGSVRVNGQMDSKLAADELLMAKDEAGNDSSSDEDDDSDNEGSPTDGSVHPSRGGKHTGLDGALLGSEHKKLGRGSCHQCKTTRESKMLLCCTSKAEKGKRKRKCRKKYCSACFAESDTRVLTNSGFLFLADIEARIDAGREVLYACYDASTHDIVYKPGQLVFPAAPPTRWVDFTHSSMRRLWDANSDDYGSTVPANGVLANRLTLRTTPEHDMYVQLCTGYEKDGQEQYQPRMAGSASIPPHKMPARELAPGYQCDCVAAGRPCTHGYSHYRMYTGAASGLQTPADVISISDHDARSPVAALGLQSKDELDAFLELFGYWLGDGSMSNDTRTDQTSNDAICFMPRTNRDCVYLHSLLARLQLKPGQHFSSTKTDMRLEVRITEPRWFRFFDDEFGGKHSNSRHYDMRLALRKQATHSTQRRPSTSTASTVSESVTVSSSRARSISASVSGERVLDYSDDDNDGDRSSCGVDAVEEEENSAASGKWLPDWSLFRLNAEQLRLVIEGVRQAAGGRAMQGEQQICTSTVGFRDQLIHACLHAGYSAYFTLNTAASEVRGYNAVPNDNCLYTEEEMETALRVDSTSQFKPVRSNHHSWSVYYSEVISELLPGQDVRFDGSACRVRQGKKLRSGHAKQQTAAIATQPADLYDQERDGRVWCVDVQHDDHLIFAQRAHRNTSDVVTKVGRTMIVGNCLQRTYAQVMANMTPADIAKWQWSDRTARLNMPHQHRTPLVIRSSPRPTVRPLMLLIG